MGWEDKIIENRITGTSKANLKLLRTLVGEGVLKNVILITTKWNLLRSEDRRRALQREQDLVDNYWADMIEKGSYVAQFDGTPGSAYPLVFQNADQESVFPYGRKLRNRTVQFWRELQV